MQLSYKALFKQVMKAFLSDHKNNKVLKFPFKILVNFELHLNRDLALKLKNLGLKEVKENADYEILINLIDMKKHSYAQKITTSARFFYDFDPLESDGEWMVENYYTMQVNLQINSKNHNSQKTSLLARTAYLGNKERCQLSLENKIINQIVSFFIFKKRQSRV